MSVSATHSSETPLGVAALLVRLRRSIRAYALAEGAAWAVLVVGLALALGVALDWWLEPPAEYRRAGWVVGAVALAWAVWRVTLRRLLRPLPDRSLAILVERRFPEFQESLITTVELSGSSVERLEFGRPMLDYARDRAAALVGGVDVRRLLRLTRLGRLVGAAALVLAGWLAWAVVAPDTARFALARLATLRDDPWPRATRLVVEGYSGGKPVVFRDGEAVVARGRDFRLLVKADTAHAVPETVALRYWYSDGSGDRKRMDREGRAAADKEPFQVFSYTFASVPSSAVLDVRGGDARLRNLRLRVVESPTLQMTLACEFPAYTARPPRELAVTGVMPLPEGTRVRVLGRASKPLTRVTIDLPRGDGTFASETLPLEPPTAAFTFDAGRLDEDRTLQFTLLDADGIETREPVRLALSAVRDEPPVVRIQLADIGAAVTPQARLPLVGQMTDDYGVAAAWIDYALDSAAAASRTFATAPAGRTEIRVEEAFELAELRPQPGMKLTVGTRAADTRNLPTTPEPNVAPGERYLLDVVTPGQLRAMLESRELTLRQRFEVILGEMQGLRDTVAGLWVPEDAAAPGPDTPPAAAADAAVDRHAANVRHVDQALADTRKNAVETRGIGEAFESIEREHVNNRIDTEELRQRLLQGIAGPLREIVERMFPELESRLRTLETVLKAEGEAGPRFDDAQRQALAQAEAVVLALEQVRDKMLELETFNEALELLRDVIAAQQQVEEETRRERAAKLRGLIEE